MEGRIGAGLGKFILYIFKVLRLGRGPVGGFYTGLFLSFSFLYSLLTGKTG